MSKHLKKKFRRLWARQKRDLQDIHGPVGDIGDLETDTNFQVYDIKRNWVDDIRGLSKHFSFTKINQSEV